MNAGLMSVAQWYPRGFGFTGAHHTVAPVTGGIAVLTAGQLVYRVVGFSQRAPPAGPTRTPISPWARETPGRLLIRRPASAAPVHDGSQRLENHCSVTGFEEFSTTADSMEPAPPVTRMRIGSRSHPPGRTDLSVSSSSHSDP